MKKSMDTSTLVMSYLVTGISQARKRVRLSFTATQWPDAVIAWQNLARGTLWQINPCLSRGKGCPPNPHLRRKRVR